MFDTDIGNRPKPRQTECRSCHAPIIFVETKTGKKMPLDAKPFSAVQVKEGVGEVIQVYMPHWATCSKADQHRRKA